MNQYPNFISFFKMVISEVGTAKGIRIKLILLLYRLASYCLNSNKLFLILLYPIYVVYRLYTEFWLGMELPAKVMAGPGLRIYHAHSLVVHPATKIGARCTLRQCVTIGNKMNKDGVFSGCPTIGDDVEMGVGAVIVGDINIGNRVSVGACTFVNKDVPDDTIIVGQSPRVIAKV